MLSFEYPLLRRKRCLLSYTYLTDFLKLVDIRYESMGPILFCKHTATSQLVQHK